MAGRKQAPYTPAWLQFWHSTGDVLSETELALCQNPFKTSWFQCDAMFSTAAQGEVLLLHCMLHFVWVPPSLFMYFFKAFGPSFSLTNTK